MNCGTCESVCDKYCVDVFSFEENSHELSLPITCFQCEDAACMDVCPAKALYRDENSTVLVDSARCIGCKLCTSACPFGNIEYNYSAGKIVKCDLCDGNPDCVKYCPTYALVYESATEANLNKKRVIAAKFTGLLDLE